MSRFAPVVALAGTAAFVCLLLALHVLRPALDPVVHTTSQYAPGPFGILMSLAFVAMSVASFALVVAFSRHDVGPERSLPGRILLGYWGIAVLVAMLFPLNEVGTDPTLSSTVHRINGPLGFFAFAAAAILLSRRFARDQRWQGIGTIAQSLSWLMLPLFAAMAFAIAGKSGFAGLAQRMLLAVAVAWMFVTAVRARALARGAAIER